jgi:hypothetical protein
MSKWSSKSCDAEIKLTHKLELKNSENKSKYR